MSNITALGGAKDVEGFMSPKATKAQGVSSSQLISMYKEMVYYRRFEERVLVAYTNQKFSGFCHVHIGQEGLCVGVQRALRKSDYMISGYRSHTQAIAKGIPGNQVFAELFGKVTGCARGKGGSMHMFSKEHRFLGGHGIVGGQAPLATGAAFRIKYMKEDDVVVCYLGDAAMNQGQVYEVMNMAATWDLPVLFIIENNRYGMGTDIRRTTSVDHLSKRALAFDMKHSQVDGMNVETVYEHVDAIVTKMRVDKKPYLLEAICYRYKGHSVSDPQNYRTKDEVSDWMKKDPIVQLGLKLVKEKIAKEKDLEDWDDEMKAQVRANEKFADESPDPELSEAWTNVYVD